MILKEDERKNKGKAYNVEICEKSKKKRGILSFSDCRYSGRVLP
jgi:hypothetical protein